MNLYIYKSGKTILSGLTIKKEKKKKNYNFSKFTRRWFLPISLQAHTKVKGLIITPVF